MAIPKLSNQTYNMVMTIWKENQEKIENVFPYDGSQLTWEDVYELWKQGSFPNSRLDEPVQIETIYVNCENLPYDMYGYDWLSVEELEYRREYAEKDPAGFLQLNCNNKGVILTAELLAKADSDEERAAVWIAATARELCNCQFGNNLYRYSQDIYDATIRHLRGKYKIAWHQATKWFIPEILVPYKMLNNILCDGFEVVMDIIQTNVLLLKNVYRITVYSSEKDGSEPGRK